MVDPRKEIRVHLILYLFITHQNVHCHLNKTTERTVSACNKYYFKTLYELILNINIL